MREWISSGGPLPCRYRELVPREAALAFWAIVP
jgi:hypothetical protein